MKTSLHYIQGALTGLCVGTAALLTTATLHADVPVNQYFTETFDNLPLYMDSSTDASTSNFITTHAYGATGGVRVRNDHGGMGPNPTITLFGEGEVFLNVNRDLIATTSTFTGTYKIQTEVTFRDGYFDPVTQTNGLSQQSEFAANPDVNATALQVFLRMDGQTSWSSGISIRFYSNGNVRLWQQVTGVGSFVEASKTGSQFDGLLPSLYSNTVSLEIEDTGTDISISMAWLDGEVEKSETITFTGITGGGDGGFIALGMSQNYMGIKFNSLAVIPEVASFAWFFGLAALGFAARRSRRRG